MDVATFQSWALRMAQTGPFRFYAPESFVDYTPGYLLVLWPVGILARHVPQAGPVLVKLPPALADFAVAGVLARLAGSRAASWYLWNPAVLCVGALWGQAESVAMAWILGGWWALQNHREALGGALLGLGVLTKPQYALVLPVIGLWAVRTGELRRENWGRVVGAGAAAVVLPSLWFGLTPTRLAALVLQAARVYPYGSVNALNLWHLLGLNWKPDATRWMGMPASVWGLLLVGAVGGTILWRCRRAREPGFFYLAAATLFLSAFSLGTRMHERYLFPALPLGILAWSHGRAGLPEVLALSSLLLVDLLYGLAYLSAHPATRTPLNHAAWNLFTPPVTAVLSFLHLALLGWMLLLLARKPA